MTGAGRYLNLNSGLFFESIGVDFVRNSIIYELIAQYDETLDKTVYRLDPQITVRPKEEVERIQKNAVKRKFTRRPN